MVEYHISFELFAQSLLQALFMLFQDIKIEFSADYFRLFRWSILLDHHRELIEEGVSRSKYIQLRLFWDWLGDSRGSWGEEWMFLDVAPVVSVSRILLEHTTNELSELNGHR